MVTNAQHALDAAIAYLPSPTTATVDARTVTDVATEFLHWLDRMDDRQDPDAT